MLKNLGFKIKSILGLDALSKSDRLLKRIKEHKGIWKKMDPDVAKSAREFVDNWNKQHPQYKDLLK